MSYEFTKLSEVPAVSEFPEGANAIIETNGEIKRCPSSGGSSVPKPLTYDYMPEGYPSKAMGTVTLLEEQELAFTLTTGKYAVTLTNILEISEGQTYTVKWDGTEYERICYAFNSMPSLGNLSIIGMGDDTGEPFLYIYNISESICQFVTTDASASHTISVKTTGEIFTPMAEEFIPATALITYDSSTDTFSSNLTNGELRKRLLSGKQIVYHPVSGNEYFYLTKWQKQSSGRIDLDFAGGGSSGGASVSLRTDGTIGGVG